MPYFSAGESVREPYWYLIIPAGTFLVMAISTLSSIYFGWRIDRRQNRESELKIKELELKIEQLIGAQGKNTETISNTRGET